MNGPDDIVEAAFMWLFPTRWVLGILLIGAVAFLVAWWMGWSLT